MILNLKYAIGVHVMFYEINMVSTYVDGLLNLLSTVENKDNVYLDFVFNVSQFFEKIDTTKTGKKELIARFHAETSRLSSAIPANIRIVDNDDEWYTQTCYRRDFNANYCNKVDILMWGETDSCFPKEAFMALDLGEELIKRAGYRYYNDAPHPSVNRLITQFNLNTMEITGEL